MTHHQKQEALFASIEAGFKAGAAPSTIVNVQKDFSQDPLRSLTNIAFIPELLDLKLVQQLFHELRTVASQQYVYPRESIHTTIKNVRTVNDPPRFTQEEIERIRPVIREVACRYQSIEIEWKGLLELPTSLAIRGFSSEALTRLVLDLHGALIQAGVPDDKRYASMELFASSCTICRYQAPLDENTRRLIQRFKQVPFGRTVLKEFSLVITDSVASKSVVRVIETFPLGR